MTDDDDARPDAAAGAPQRLRLAVADADLATASALALHRLRQKIEDEMERRARARRLRLGGWRSGGRSRMTERTMAAVISAERARVQTWLDAALADDRADPVALALTLMEAGVQLAEAAEGREAARRALARLALAYGAGGGGGAC
ncbi:MAG: hypothetical protein R6V44_01705 [Paracoccaceae bacterium]